MTSRVHPYSREIGLEGIGTFNYIRNSVKATVDAYDGTVHLYVFDPDDPLLQAYRNLFPALFEPASAMPADLRAHVRYPEMIFAAQAEIYRLFHMRDPDTFYNKSDAWDIAKFTSEQNSQPAPGDAHLRGGHFARRDEAGISADDSVYAAQSRQSHRTHDGALRWRAPGREGGVAAIEAGDHLRARCKSRRGSTRIRISRRI